ncbi:hypothetical protein GCM10010981_28230 [Dyella nitratireducens]|uniref:Uncharacterized protein n=2 Tax=Dyella nitratireducens TaxID=1849580 RepID=A0ABQ1G615_9GAMM|nr:hypothetical protein GCM10010981_28230 [Dyella nitratireducens]
MMGDNLLQKHHHHYQDDWTNLQNLTERSHELSTDIREIQTKIKGVYNNSSLTPAQQNSAVRGLRKEMQKLVKEKKSIDTQLAKLLATPVDTDRAMISNYIDSLGRGYLL